MVTNGTRKERDEQRRVPIEYGCHFLKQILENHSFTLGVSEVLVTCPNCYNCISSAVQAHGIAVFFSGVQKMLLNFPWPTSQGYFMLYAPALSLRRCSGCSSHSPILSHHFSLLTCATVVLMHIIYLQMLVLAVKNKCQFTTSSSCLRTRHPCHFYPDKPV